MAHNAFDIQNTAPPEQDPYPKGELAPFDANIEPMMVALAPSAPVQPDFSPQALPQTESNPWGDWRRKARMPKDVKAPQGYGLKMLNYLMFRNLATPPSQEPGEKSPDQKPVYTEYPEALKNALTVLGVTSERNPLGLSLDIDSARTLWFPEGSEISGTDEAEFRAIMEGGDQAVDRKRIRQFVNYDGSTTWEILNPDKTTMSRFTLGDHKGKKIFVQGGYDAYAKELRKLADKSSKNATSGGSADFDKLRQMFSKGV